MYGTWTPVEDKNPEQLKHVLFLTRRGEIYKGFLNLRNTWIIENAEGLVTAYMKDTDAVAHWMELPDRDADWKKAGEEPPEESSRVLAMDYSGEVFIVEAHKNVWIIRNIKGSESTFSIWPKEGSLWMPLPEGL